jgi:hypothetical protein
VFCWARAVDYALMSSGEPVIMMPLVINRESPVVTHSTRLKSSKNAVWGLNPDTSP